jgi:hypothetical protein
MWNLSQEAGHRAAAIDIIALGGVTVTTRSGASTDRSLIQRNGGSQIQAEAALIDGFANDLGDERLLQCEVVTEASLREPCFFHQLG